MNENEKRFRIQVLGGKEFRLPLTKRNTVSWQMMSTRDILAYARAYVKEFNIVCQSELNGGSNSNYGLYIKLYKEGWLKFLFPYPKPRIQILAGKKFIIPLRLQDRIDWEKINRKKTVLYAQAYCEEYGITSSKELQSGKHKNPGLQTRLYITDLLAKVFGWKKYRKMVLAGKTFKIPLNGSGRVSWERMSSRRIITYARAYCLEHGINGSGALSNGPKRDTGMYRQLREKNLLDKVFDRPTIKIEILNGHKYRLPLCRNGIINWQKISDNILTNYATDYREEYHLANKTAMKQNRALLYQLQTRSLTDNVFPRKYKIIHYAGKEFALPLVGDRIRWSAVDEKMFFELAEAYCLENCITNVSGLIKNKANDFGLYKWLHKRRLMHRLFGILDKRIECFGGKLFSFPLDSRQRIKWVGMEDQAILDYAAAYCGEYGLTYQAELAKKNLALHSVLSARNLLDRIFPHKITVTVSLEARKFLFSKRGKHFSWINVNEDVLDIYAAAVCRAENKRIDDLPCGLRKGIRRQTVRQYIDKLPNLDPDTSKKLRLKYKVGSNYDLPEELLSAFGYERDEDARIRLKIIRKFTIKEKPPESEIPNIGE